MLLRPAKDKKSYKKKRLLEKRIKKVKAEMKRLEASRKDIHEIYSASSQNIFHKPHCWWTNRMENNLFHQIDD